MGDNNNNNIFENTDSFNSDIEAFDLWFRDNNITSIIDVFAEYNAIINSECEIEYIVNNIEFISDKGNNYYTKPINSHTNNFILKILTDIIKSKF